MFKILIGLILISINEQSKKFFGKNNTCFLKKHFCFWQQKYKYYSFLNLLYVMIKK